MDDMDFSSRVKRLQIISSQLIEGMFSGNYRSTFKGPGLEFNEVREYQDGDDIRFIDWNVTSRMQSPYTKTFKEERELILNIVMDVSASLSEVGGGKSKRAVAETLFGIIAFAAVANNDRVGVLMFSDIIEHSVSPMKGKKHVLRLIHDVLTLKPKSKGSDLALALRTAQESMKKRGICFVLSDFRSANYYKELSILSRKQDVIAVKIIDKLEREFPNTGLISLEDPETGEIVRGFGRSKKFRQKYKEFWELERLHWTNNCKKLGIGILEIDTEEDPGQALLKFFNKRKKR
ncbi:MAG: DUF58 domain-containing protein [Spirochaetaceae bacterium 4572_7]|nr:MAG: DUF58 domain-containing protein [Spirochaetaceae bacterium 4572_7]